MKFVKNLLADDLKKFDTIFSQSLASPIGLLNKVAKYVSFQKGKQLRPILVMLAARMCGGISEDTYRAACLIEYLHTATLVHDDVVDDSYVRRKNYSVKALWGNKLSVLFGDYMLSKGLLLALDNKDFSSLYILSSAVRQMSEAEILQLETSTYGSMNEKTYYEVIKGKTASLFAAACSIGAWSAIKDEEKKKLLYDIGDNFGMAFQIKDDISDFNNVSLTGKPQWRDLKNKKATLPYLYALENCSDQDRQKLQMLFNEDNVKEDKINEVVEILKETGGIDYASKIMVNYADIAVEKLKTFPNSVERLAFEDIIRYSVYSYNT